MCTPSASSGKGDILISCCRAEDMGPYWLSHNILPDGRVESVIEHTYDGRSLDKTIIKQEVVANKG